MYSFYTYASPIDEFDKDVLLLQLVVDNCGVDIGKYEARQIDTEFSFPEICFKCKHHDRECEDML